MHWESREKIRTIEKDQSNSDLNTHYVGLKWKTKKKYR